VIKFRKVQAIPLSKVPAKVLIRWETDVRSAAELVDYEFLVLRQTNGQDNVPNFQDVDIDGKLKTPTPETIPALNLQAISTWIDGLDQPWFMDYSDVLKNLTHQSTYRVKCRHKKTLEETISEQFAHEGNLDLVGLYIVDEHNFLLKDVTGVPSLIYQRRRGGIMCPKCYDPIQKKRTMSHCTSCYGTNWVGGFFNPIQSYVDFNPNPKNITISQWGEVQENETQALMSNFPSVVPGDIVRELPENRLWRVVLVTVTEKRRVQMLQFVRLSEIKPADVEYSIPNDERFQIKQLDEFDKIKKKTEF